MPYEIDFLANSAVKQDADAICFRFKNNESSRYTICIFDGGTSDYSDTIMEHLKKYYDDPVTIDFVFCSHPDQDHASGLKKILESYTVENLVMNRPWLYAHALYPRVNDGRITEQSLERQLRESFPYAEALEKIALEKGIRIWDAFEGMVFANYLKVMSPSKSFYLDLLAQSHKTAAMDASMEQTFTQRAISKIYNFIDTWFKDSLRENVTTSEENESSIILLGEMSEENFLLTGDAGIRALSNAIEYAQKQGIDFVKDVSFYQIPHHGGRHNLSPSIMNKFVGTIVGCGANSNKTSVVSAAKDSDHPKRMVVNAFIRRGCSVTATKGKTVCHHNGLPLRDGWNTATQEAFSDHVEDWED